MGLITREQVFAACELASETVEVPEFGEGAAVRVRAFNLGARNAFYAPLWAAPEAERASTAAQMDEARLVAFAVVDAEGNAVFSEADIPMLRNLAPEPLDRIAAVARRLNGLGGKAAETAAKN